MNRRRLIGAVSGAILGLPAAARAQRGVIPVVGYLAASTAESGMPYVPSFHEGLRETGHVVGRNVSIAFRWASNRHEQLPALASELVAANVAVIAATNSLAAVAAKQITQTVPIVFLSGDPVALGLVASLGRPGGNATGTSILTPQLTPKRLELVRELLPGSQSVAFLTAPANPATTHERVEIQAASRVTGHRLQIIDVGSEVEVEQALARLAGQRPDVPLWAPGRSSSASATG
jgi:putative ABC transport system substrate-binding protein